MKKKYFALSLAAALCITAAACGAGSSSGTSSSVPSAPASSAASTSSAPSSAPSDTSDGPSFADSVLTMDDYTITITDYKTIQPGEKGNEDGSKPLLVFFYDTTNTGSETAFTPLAAWVRVLQPLQATASGQAAILPVGPQTEDQFIVTELQKIEPGDTVSSAISYKLEDTSTVTLVALDSSNGIYGQQEFSLAS